MSKIATKQKPDWRKLFNYGWLVKNVPFFLFLSALTVAYIANGHYADKMIRQINAQSRLVKDLQHEYKTIKSELMFRSKQSELIKVVEPMGLKPLLQPAVRIERNPQSNQPTR